MLSDIYESETSSIDESDSETNNSPKIFDNITTSVDDNQYTDNKNVDNFSFLSSENKQFNFCFNNSVNENDIMHGKSKFLFM